MEVVETPEYMCKHIGWENSYGVPPGVTSIASPMNPSPPPSKDLPTKKWPDHIIQCGTVTVRMISILA